VKRGLEHVEGEITKRQCWDSALSTEFYLVKLQITLPEACSGVRAAIYKIADDHGAFRHTKNPGFYVENNGQVLFMSMYFANGSGARGYMRAITEAGAYWSLGFVRVTCPDMFTVVVLPYDDMRSLYRIHYNTNDNVHSPDFALYDVDLERLDLCDLDHLQCLRGLPRTLRYVHTNVILHPKSDIGRMRRMRTTL
jgi:hypothetical protein